MDAGLAAEFGDVTGDAEAQEMNLSMGMHVPKVGMGKGGSGRARSEQNAVEAEHPSDDEIAAASAEALERLKARRAGKPGGNGPGGDGVTASASGATSKASGAKPGASGRKASSGASAAQSATAAPADTIVRNTGPLPPLRNGKGAGDAQSTAAGDAGRAVVGPDGQLDAATAQALVDEEFAKLGRHLEGVVVATMERLLPAAEQREASAAKPSRARIPGTVFAVVAAVTLVTGWIVRGAADEHVTAPAWSATEAGRQWAAVGERNPAGSRLDITSCSARAGLVITKTRRGRVCSAPGAHEGWLIP